MTTATQTAANSKTPYKTLLVRAKNLQQTAKANVYARVKLLVRVYRDEQFRLEHGANDFALADVLDQYLDDTGWGFWELKTILEYFPNRDDWRNHRLTKLHADVMAEKRRQAKAATASTAKPKAKKPTKADVAKAEKDASYWKAKYQAAAARAVERQADWEAKRPTDAQPTDEASASLPEQLAQAKARIAELEQENAVLRRRVRKLQVLLHEAPAVV